MKRPAKVIAALSLIGLGSPVLTGCLAATAIDIAAETVEAGVEITGAVVGTSVDLVTTSEEERERKRKKD
ncbi:MAG: hypothetical protein CMK09_17875 [Ponticaulis sp.]|nr:hypothetical protein [Ponticaulis sp.]|tara:strand:- start:918 stop:1127 length:210 start_codon:yes stop_codon:yes gene_type:complete